MFYSDDDSVFEICISKLDAYFDQFGITIHKDKSQISKKQGIWQVNRLKFLGIVYEPQAQKLSSQTRSGRSLLWNFEILTALSLKLSNTKLPKNRHASYRTHLMMYGYLLQSLLSGDIARFFYFLRLNLITMSDKRRLTKFISSLPSSWAANMHWSPEAMQSQYETAKLQVQTVVDLDFKVEELPETQKFMGVYSGLILSRLYNGSLTISKFETPSGLQNFRLSYRTGSWAHIYESSFPKWITIHNGSSYATYDYAGYSRWLVTKSESSPAYRLLTKGPLRQERLKFT